MPELEVHCSTHSQGDYFPGEILVNGGFPAQISWGDFIQQVYGFKYYRFEAREDDNIVGVLMLTEVHHPLFGHYLTSAPFASYGGFAYSTEKVRDTLLDSAKKLRDELHVEYVVARFDRGNTTPLPGWTQQAIYSTYLVDLKPGLEKIMAGFSSNHRNHVRKSQKKGFNIRFGFLELLDNVYEGLAKSMHELGSPYHRKEYLHAMAKSLGKQLEFSVVYDSDGKIVGSGVFILQGQLVTNLHANILRKYRSDYAGEFFYWSIIEHYCQIGMQTFDLGRSLIGSGNESFKLKWKPHVQLLSYWYALSPGGSIPDLNQKNPKFQLAIALWKRLPYPIVRFFGSYLIRGLA